MLWWLRRRLRRWLGIESESVSPVFEAVVDGEVRRVIALRSVGLHLVCKIPRDRGASERLVSESQACDRKHYRRLLENLGGLQNLIWDDGTRYGNELGDQQLGEKYSDYR